jgi:type II secretory pathway pseudopilin PulG
MMPDTTLHAELASGNERGGFSLLEVLVSSGILVIGLAGVAALIPAATARLGEASVSDRAASLSANAFADIMSRRDKLLSANRFAPGQTIIAFGSPELVSKMQAVHKNLENCSVQNTVADWFTTQTVNAYPWFSHDLLEYERDSNGLPANSFVGDVRQFRQELCWFATVAAATAGSGLPAVLTIAIVKKPDADVRQFSLAAAGGVFSTTANDEERRTFFKGCSAVLNAESDPPSWLHINSSWTEGWPSNLNANSTRVIFSGTASPTSVIAFEHVVRVDSYPIYLD